MTEPLLTVGGLSVAVPVADGWRRIVVDVSLKIAAGEALGLVGESGSGKSITARAIIRLLPRRTKIDGDIRFDGRSVTAMTDRELRRYRSSDVAMVFQDPRAYINPVRRLGDFLTEGLIATHGVTRKEADARARELLDAVRVPDASHRLRQYPHELSGGLLQRVMIAAALAGRPRLLLADEPTTALDVTTQAKVMALLMDLRREFGLALLFITHDLELAAATCDRTAVMYAGSIAEEQASELLHEHPGHPYTAALVAARPGVAAAADRIAVIPGVPVSAFDAPEGCPFWPRCSYVQTRCREERPLPEGGPTGGQVACHRAGEFVTSALHRSGHA